MTFGKDSEFVLLASDGLWDYINRFVGLVFDTLGKTPCNYHILINLIAHVKLDNFFSSDAVAFVRNQLRQHGDVQVWLVHQFA